MNKESFKYPQLKSKYEFLAFLEFIRKATEWETTETDDVFYSKHGIDGITNEPIYIYLQSYCDSYLAIPKELAKTKRAFIRLSERLSEWSVNDYEINYNEEIVLGPSFVKDLALKNPELWWLFVASSSEKCRIITDKDRKNLVLTADKLPCIYDMIGVVPRLEANKVSRLSAIFEKDFIYQRKNSSKDTYVIIGNGTSIPFGSDLWSQLSDYLFDYLKPQYIENDKLVKKAIGDNNFSTTSMAKTIVNPYKFEDALHSCIYRKYENTMHTNSTLVREIVLSKIANPNLKLITYNYDEFLERDYNIFCEQERKIQTVASAKEDSSTEEPKLLHVHGFFSLDKRVKKGLVLTQEEYYKTYKNDNWVVRTQETALKNNCLYVGSSMSDLFQMSIIEKVRDAYYKDAPKYIFMKPWKCYALLCLKGLESRDVATIYSYYLNKGIRIIFTKDFDDLPLKYADLMRQ